MVNSSLIPWVEALEEAYRSGHAATLPPPGRKLAGTDALDVQNEVLRRRAAGGSTRTCAFKVGMADPPTLGQALSRDVVLDRGTIDSGELFRPLVEPEVGLVIGERLVGDDMTVIDVLRAVQFVVPAFEIVDRRTEPGPEPQSADEMIADNGWLGRVVLGGTPRRVSDLDLTAIPVELRADGRVVGQGRSDRPSANPAHAVITAARLLHSVGLTIEPGQTILTGSCIEPHRPGRGTTVRAEFGGLGHVEVTFD